MAKRLLIGVAVIAGLGRLKAGKARDHIARAVFALKLHMPCAAREELARLADAVATDEAPDRLDAVADACREAADRLARFRAVCGF